jgi:hypothetical protein
MANAHLDLDAAAATPSRHPTGHKDVVARIDELLGLDLKVLPHFVHLLDEVPVSVEAAMDARIEDISGQIETTSGWASSERVEKSRPAPNP